MPYNFVCKIPQEGEFIIKSQASAAGESPGIEKELILEEEENHISWQVRREESDIIVNITANRPERPILHWGISGKEEGRWYTPPPVVWPLKTADMQNGQAVQTPMKGKGRNRYAVVITIPQDLEISHIYFVLFFSLSHQWDNNHHRDYEIFIPSRHPVPEGLEQDGARVGLVIRKILDRESRKHWEMGMRLEFIQGLLSCSSIDESTLRILEIYVQYAAQGYLPWRRQYDRQTYILAPKVQEFALNLARQLHRYPQFLPIFRRILKNFPSSGRDLKSIGTAIRLKILVCKDHQNRHIYDAFMYEFHQKLHNASGPEDITIARAYLAFLHSEGDLNQFYQVLSEGGLARREGDEPQGDLILLLGQYGDNRAIHSLPSYDGRKAENTRKVIRELLELLEKFYGGVEIEEGIERVWSRGDEELRQQGQDLIDKKKDLDRKFSAESATIIFRQVADLRKKLLALIFRAQGEEDIRDFLLLDISLEDYAMALANSLLNLYMDPNGSRPAFSEWLPWLQTLISHLSPSGLSDPELPAIEAQLQQWKERENHNPDWYLQGKAIFDRLNHLIRRLVMNRINFYQPQAEALGRSLAIQPRAWQAFSEENIRASWLFLLSRSVSYSQKVLRSLAGWPAIEVLVAGKVRGILSHRKRLMDQSSVQANGPQVLLLDYMQGDEDIPQGVAGIITRLARDRLSHFGIRAREQGVAWVSLEDDPEYEKIKSLEGQWIELRAGDDHFQCLAIETPGPVTMRRKGEKKGIQLPEVRLTDSFEILAPDQYQLSTVGPKAYQLSLLQKRLSHHLLVPDSLCLPFGIFDLLLGNNPESIRDYETLTAEIGKGMENGFQSRLKNLRLLIESFEIDQTHLAALEKAIRERLGEVFLILRSSSNAEDLAGYSGAGLYESYAGVFSFTLSQVMKKVYASKWTDRAVSNRFKAGINHDQVHLAILIQQLIPADYAFVAHTHHPISQNRNQIYIEIVQGLGEALVAGSEGQGYRFEYDRTVDQARRIGYASKGYRWMVEANGKIKRVPTDYSEDILAGHQPDWEFIIRHIAQTSIMIEDICDHQPQDIEGVIRGREIYIVQARPQIGWNWSR